jgi:transcriptional regulator with XRE-family HTH domain
MAGVTPAEPEDEGTELGRIVKRYRKARGLSAERLGAMAGLSNGYVTLLETGRRGKRPSRDNVIALAQALHAPVAELLRAAGLLEPGEALDAEGRPPFRAFVQTDPVLRSDQKDILIRLYESYVGRQG